MATILIVDDHAVDREFLVQLLQYQGHHLLEAADGAEGLAVARTEQPNLIITDILMPAMDGFEFVRQLRADPAIAPTKVIFYTAPYYEHEARNLAGDYGATDFLTKSAKPQVVLKTVNTALGLAKAPSPPPSVEAFDQEQLRLMANDLSKKVTELEAGNLRLTALIELGQQLTLEHDTTRLLEMICNGARELIGAKYAAVGILDEEGVELRHFLTSGLDAATAAHVGSPSPQQGLLGEVLQQTRPLRRHNLSADPQSAGLPAHHPAVRSFLGAPIASVTGLCGLLYLADKLGAAEFSPEDERLVVTLAAQVWPAYENSLAYAEIQGHAAELEQQVNEATAELRRSNFELEQFAYVASHDLQEPLRMVSSYCQLLERRYKGQLDAKADKYIAYAVDGATRMQVLINDLLSYSRVGRKGKAFEPTDCQQVFNQACANLRQIIRKREAQISCDPLPTVPADVSQLVSLFQNLIGNAIKFCHEEPPCVQVSVERNEQVWHFSVRDNGIGIEPDYFERIFTIFQRLHGKEEYPGTGIGLALCWKIVERHRGHIWVESELGHGTTFHFTLPDQPGINQIL